MLNTELLLYFTGYILTLFIGFAIKRADKDKHNKTYKRYKKFLFSLIVLIFLSTTSLLLLISNKNHYFYTFFILNFMFATYITTETFHKTRCWKQHRMIIYNFFAVLLFYLSSETFNNEYFLCGIFLIYIYNILEFQFAKFSLKSPLIWD